MNCSICLQSCPRETAYYLTCGHYYHLNCIYKWSKDHTECPECRKPLDKEKLRRDAEPDIDNVIEVRDIDAQFNEIYNESVKPIINQELWRTGVYQIYNRVSNNGFFGFDERVSFVKQLVEYQKENKSYYPRPPMISLVNLVMPEFEFTRYQKFKVLFRISLLIGMVLTIFVLHIVEIISDRNDLSEIRVLAFVAVVLITLIYIMIGVRIILSYRSYGVSAKDYLRGHAIISTYSSCTC